MDWFNLHCLSLHLCMSRTAEQLGVLKEHFFTPCQFPFYSTSTMKKANDLWSKQICKWAYTTSACHTTNLLMGDKKSRTCSVQLAGSDHRHIHLCLRGSKKLPRIIHLSIKKMTLNQALNKKNILAQLPRHTTHWMQVLKKRHSLKWVKEEKTNPTPSDYKEKKEMMIVSW